MGLAAGIADEVPGELLGDTHRLAARDATLAVSDVTPVYGRHNRRRRTFTQAF